MTATALQHRAKIDEATVSALLGKLRERVGITIETPRWLIEDYLQQRISALGIANLHEYTDSLDHGLESRAEWLALVDLLTVKETRFFRQTEAFALVREQLAQRAAADELTPEVAVWSVGCSTGEELYSLGMVVDQQLRASGCNLDWHGIGTDISFGAIARARAATYPDRQLQGVPLPCRRAYLEPAGDQQYRVVDSIRQRSNFFHSNLLHVDSAPFAMFDVVFCQNVLIYFDRATRIRILDALFARTRPAGLLVLGAGEDIGWHASGTERVSTRGVTAFKKLEV